MSNEMPGIEFLSGGGEMGALTRAYDWENSSLGPPENWPQSLRVTVRLLLNTGHPMFIWWGPDLIQFYNDAYAETMGPERHPGALGDRGRDCWAEIWPIIGPQIDYVMAGKGSTWDEDRLVPVTRHGKRENVWWTYSYGPIDLEGGVGGVLVVCNDVTEQHLAKEALEDQSRRFEQLFEQAPGFMTVLRGPDHVFELCNAAYRQLVGKRDLVGKSLREALPEVEGQSFFELMDEVYTTGKAFVGRRLPLRVFPEATGRAVDMFVDFVYQPIVEPDGQVSGVFVEGVNVTDHVQAEEHLQMLNEELKHRVKNTLAMVSAIANQTFRASGEDGKVKAFQDRLAAFGKVHDILTAAASATAPIQDVVRGALAPHWNDERQFVISGPAVVLGSKQALSLALAIHELATNANKYGALSSEAGRVHVSWRIEADAFHFEWRETGGPTVSKPSKKGFGSQLIKRVLTADFEGKVEVVYDPAGLICRLEAPVGNLGANFMISAMRK